MLLGPLQNNLAGATGPSARVHWLEVQAPMARVHWLEVELLALAATTDTDQYRRWARDVMSMRVSGDGNAVMVAIGRRRQR